MTVAQSASAITPSCSCWPRTGCAQVKWFDSRLDDIDWREDRIRVRQSKTGVESHLPLVGPVGEALLKYLQKGRPKTDAREVFISIRAPYRPFRNGSSSVCGCRAASQTDRL